MQQLSATESQEPSPHALGPPMAPRALPPTAEDLATYYANRVHRFAVVVSPPGTDPQDLAQEALVKALRAVDRFEPSQGSLDAWLWRIVVNTARDAGRMAGRTQLLLERIGVRAEMDHAESAEALALKRIDDRLLLEAVRRLPKRYRGLIALRFGAGLTYPEIADAVGSSRMAVLKATQRALERLRNDLEVNAS
jgi:RNA polymerase sigma factor (sigma-70 family)